MSHEEFYQTLARKINKKLARKAISARKIESVVEQAKQVRARNGVHGLLKFANSLPSQFFTEAEIEELQASKDWDLFTGQMMRILVYEHVITPFEAQMLSRYI